MKVVYIVEPCDLEDGYAPKDVVWNYCLKLEELREELERTTVESQINEITEAMQSIELIICAFMKMFVDKGETAPDEYDPRRT